MKMFIIILVLSTCFNLYGTQVKIDPLVQIKQGLVRGLLSEDGLYSYFLGIPYGKVDPDHPFGAAKPALNFTSEVFNAKFGGVICPQRVNDLYVDDIVITADCLVLNIYVPYEASENNILPVLVWIHGGQFTSGSGYSYNPEYFMDKGIIVVTINYRLGPYGFLCLDTPHFPGNQGLKDQHLAMEWVNDNIAAFRGNPDEVTIGGQGAGSSSVLLHLYSSKEKLYNKVIAQSGTPMSDIHFALADHDAAINLATYLGFNTTDTESAIEFLSAASYDDVDRAFFALNPILQPCKETSFSGVKNMVTSYPFSLSNAVKIKDTPILIGNTNGESAESVTSSNYFESNPFLDRLKENFKFANEQELLEAVETLKLFYVGDEELSTYTNTLIGLINFESDLKYNYPTQITITNLLNENASPMYQYLFKYVSDGSALVAKHNDDLNFLFKTDKRLSEEDKLFSKRITTLWANFIKYGNPTPTLTDLLPVIWPPATNEKRSYMQLDKELEVKSRVFNDRLALWEFFYRVYGKYHRFADKC